MVNALKVIETDMLIRFLQAIMFFADFILYLANSLIYRSLDIVYIHIAYKHQYIDKRVKEHVFHGLNNCGNH